MPLFNILIRTSDRPNFFEKCYESVCNQTHNDYRVIVSADNRQTYDYVSTYPVDIVMVDPMPGHCFWNLYMNQLLRQVAEGWVVYLDDDATMVPGALETISRYADSKKKVIVWKYQFLSGRIIPEPEFWRKPPQRKHFDTGCFSHHISQPVTWVSARASDWRVATQLWNRKLRFVWVDKVLFHAGNNGDVGKKTDL